MAYSLKEQLSKEERFVGGHRLCAGCGAGITVRAVLRALEPEDKAVITNATGCLEVSSFLYPYTAYTDSYIHCAFENAAATCGGVEAAYNVLKRKGKIQDNFKFITFGGDGGTYDIGFQSLSGAMERGHDMVYVCYDNEAYMNTGIQRSSSTPRFADATTTPVGTASYGKKQNKKDFPMIMAMHDIPYMATMSPAYIPDMVKKLEKAMAVENGLAYLHVYNPCVTGWGCKSDESIEVARLAVETNFAPLYEVENGKFSMSVNVKEPKPVKDFVTRFKKFRHLTEEDIQGLQELTDTRFARLQKLCQD